MAAFQYIAYDNAGKKVKGVLVADGLAQARAQLTGDGLFPETLTETNAARTSGRHFWQRRAILSAENLAVFSRQIAVLLTAGIPVDSALNVLMDSDVGGQVNRAAAELQTHIRDGRTLSVAMGRLPGAFPDYYRAAVAAGENSGELDRICVVLADFIETRLAMRDSTANSLIYPLFVGAVSLMVAGILLINVVPELVVLFEQTGQPLPGLTLASIAIGDFLAAHWRGLFAGLALSILLLRYLYSLPGPRAVFHNVQLRIPVFGPLARLKAAVLYLRTLSLVLTANMPAVAAMRYATDAIDNVALQRAASGSHELVEEGQPIAVALKQVPALPVIALQMLESGEKSGRLAEMAERAANLAETSLAIRSQRVSTLLEPLMMMVVGGLVLLVVLSVMLPIFDLQTSFVN